MSYILADIAIVQVRYFKQELGEFELTEWH